MIRELLRLRIRDQAALFAFRQAGREAGDAVGLAGSELTRMAAAISEIGRELYAAHGPVEAVFRIRRVGRPALVVEMGVVRRTGRPLPREAMTVAARLVDRIESDEEEGRTVVRVSKDLPPSAPPPSDDRVRRVRERLARLVPTSAPTELERQNRELIEALENVQRQHEELQALHAELEDKSAQLRRTGEVKNRFWANISHELRTPINSMIGLARLLLDSRGDPLSDEQRHQVELIAHSGQTILALVDELLEMAKAEEGRLVLRNAPVDVPLMLERLRSLMEPMAEEAGLRLEVDAETADVQPLADETLLTRVLRNLLANGVNFTRAGAVRLSARAEGDHMVFTVSDTGAGIPEAERERVFEEFYQVLGTRGGGTGLGLPYARRLAEAMGGGLELDSAVGSGTTVTVRIPLRPPSRDDDGSGRGRR
ncbi:sensor histidine kinase [Thermomonospora catenispora]|uniref:sensor histidine kinase n=1 Tax=Thermomonospora catenispora TaxID=2493090 RepID=UPI0011222675|nr:HAMP domain-containing sensor histidine kinase [Thermomonospora catenispora]TNY37360.1 sensor histidine kinase [Thermomonospora catenispora]